MTERADIAQPRRRPCCEAGANCPLAVLVAAVRPSELAAGGACQSRAGSQLCLHKLLDGSSEWDAPYASAGRPVTLKRWPLGAESLLRAGRWAAYDHSVDHVTPVDCGSLVARTVRQTDRGGAMRGHGAFGALEQPSHMTVLNKEVRAVLFADVADSVRMMQRAEEAVVRRWAEVFKTVVEDIAPRHAGRLVKSTGDGFVFDFKSPQKAVACALAIQEFLRHFNAKIIAPEAIELRIGVDVGEIFIGDMDIYGHRVNLAARLMSSLARPGQIVVSAETHDLLAPGLDGDCEDLGEKVLKGMDFPVRAYLVWPPGFRPTARLASPLSRMMPAIAILPFAARMTAPEHAVLGDILVDSAIRALSRSLNIDVISSRSAMQYRNRDDPLVDIGRQLRATFVLSGSYITDGTTLRLSVELSDVRTQRVIWSDRFTDKLAGLLTDESDLVNLVVRGAYEAISSTELRRVRLNSLDTVDSYSLLLAAIVLMHRRSARDFLTAREMLETISEREPRHPLPKAWLANWYVLRIQQGLSTDFALDRSEAVRCTSAALDVDPENSLALATAGLVHTHMTKRHDLAAESYRLATESNPNDALAWLLQGTHKAFTGEGEAAVKDTQRALRLSPLDPQSYYFNSLSASAFLVNGENERALQYADEALRSNKLHTSSLRAKAVASWRLGKHAEAVATGVRLLQHEPGFTVSGWLKRSPMSEYAIGRELADTLRSLGLPN